MIERFTFDARQSGSRVRTAVNEDDKSVVYISSKSPLEDGDCKTITLPKERRRKIRRPDAIRASGWCA